MRSFPTAVGTIHFTGIGGIGMSGIAEVLHNLGYRVQGSDADENANTRRLNRLGVPTFVGHSQEHIQQAAAVVVSSAIPPGNPELLRARALGIPVVRRAEMLGELMRLRRAVAVAGSHGKTTTTSLIAALFDQAGLDPTVVNGGIINAYGSNARLGSGDWIVVESDESDGSFSKLPATICIVTNIDQEHVEHFKSYEALILSFAQFISNIPFYGIAILCADHPVVADLARKTVDRRVLTYGFAETADVSVEHYTLSAKAMVFSVRFSEKCLALYSEALGTEEKRSLWKNFSLPMVGKHNIQNALAVVALALELKIPPGEVLAAFRSFMGVGRRFSILSEANGVRVVDDYGHHPVEIRATLEAARSITSGRVWAVIQPHRYTRLNNLFAEFVDVLTLADHTFVIPLYTAGEIPIEGVGSRELVNAGLSRTASVSYVDSEIALREELLPKLASGDTVIFLGAGTVSRWAHNFSENFLSSHSGGAV